jgi:hypothetical protein
MSWPDLGTTHGRFTTIGSMDNDSQLAVTLLHQLTPHTRDVLGCVQGARHALAAKLLVQLLTPDELNAIISGGVIQQRDRETLISPLGLRVIAAACREKTASSPRLEDLLGWSTAAAKISHGLA